MKRQRYLKKIAAAAREQEESRTSEFYSLVGLLVAISVAFLILKLPHATMYVRALAFVQVEKGKNIFLLVTFLFGKNVNYD